MFFLGHSPIITTGCIILAAQESDVDKEGQVPKLKPRQKKILEALEGLGGKGTTRQIAERTNLHVNGVLNLLECYRNPIAKEGRWSVTWWWAGGVERARR